MNFTQNVTRTLTTGTDLGMGSCHYYELATTAAAVAKVVTIGILCEVQSTGHGHILVNYQLFAFHCGTKSVFKFGDVWVVHPSYKHELGLYSFG